MKYWCFIGLLGILAQPFPHCVPCFQDGTFPDSQGPEGGIDGGTTQTWSLPSASLLKLKLPSFVLGWKGFNKKWNTSNPQLVIRFDPNPLDIFVGYLCDGFDWLTCFEIDSWKAFHWVWVFSYSESLLLCAYFLIPLLKLGSRFLAMLLEGINCLAVFWVCLLTAGHYDFPWLTLLCFLYSLPPNLSLCYHLKNFIKTNMTRWIYDDCYDGHWLTEFSPWWDAFSAVLENLKYIKCESFVKFVHIYKFQLSSLA